MEQVFYDYQTVNWVFGWWGVIAWIGNIVALRGNIESHRDARRLLAAFEEMLRDEHTAIEHPGLGDGAAWRQESRAVSDLRVVCPVCGKEAQLEDKFCSGCGGAMPEVKVVDKKKAEPGARVAQAEKGRSGWMWAWVIVVTCICVVLLFNWWLHEYFIEAFLKAATTWAIFAGVPLLFRAVSK